MGYPDRATVCISSQAGCGMACPFCATGQGGLQRNMSTAEIVEQVRVGGRRRTRRGARRRRPGTAVEHRLHGHGRAAGELPPGRRRRCTASATPRRTAWASRQRSVTVSTVGLVPAIHRLADEGLQVTLAVSLHTPDDELRDTLVPVNTRWPVREVLEAARHYADVTGRRVSIEYALIRDINDQPWRADLLAKLPARTSAGSCTSTSSRSTRPRARSGTPSPATVQAEFVRRVRQGGVACTVRDTRGREIAAACGQLAAGAAEPSPAETSPARDQPGHRAATGG